MNLFDDDENVSADDLMAGRAAPGREPLAAVLGQLRALADEPAPAPTPALVAVLRDGLPAAALARPAAAAGTRTPLLRTLRWAAGLGVAGKILLSAGVAAAAVAGTATLPVVPDSVQAPVRAALADLGHLIPGSAGGSVPVPSATTPEPVDGVVTPVDPPSAEPAGARLEHRVDAPGRDERSSPDSAPTPRGRSGDQGEQQPGPASGPQETQGAGNEQGRDAPRPSASAGANASGGGSGQKNGGQGSSGGGGKDG